MIAMGKCGAKELNYISDVDVIFAADHPPAERQRERRTDEARDARHGHAAGHRA